MTDIKFDRQSLKENLSKAIQQVVILNFTVPESLRRRQSFIPSMSRAQHSERQSAQLLTNGSNINNVNNINNVGNTSILRH